MVKIYFTLFLFIIILNLTFSIDIKDKIIIIIRHGEKISEETTDLSPKGLARAKCLPNLFSDSGLNYIPSKLYANKKNENSTRPYDTIEPLAKKLNLTIEVFDKSTDQQITDFVQNKLIVDQHDIILVSSSQSVIPKITKLLGHEIIVPEEEFDKYFIWKNGKYETEGNQSDYIGNCIKEHSGSFFLKRNFLTIFIFILFLLI